MPRRATKRGAERTPLSGRWDVVICGASFAGLAVARELRSTGARVLVVDRYEIGERQTSACAAPTELLRHMGLEASIRQTFGELVVHTPKVPEARWPLPFTFSTFDYAQLCELLWEQCGEAEFDTAKVNGRTGNVVHTDRGDIEAPILVDACGWRRVLSDGPAIQPPAATLSRGLEVHPAGVGDDLELWLDTRYVSPGYSWSFPAGDEVRVGVGSFDPRIGVKAPTLALVEDVGRSPDGYQGNWIPHRLRGAVEDGVAFVGDSAGHCLPLTAEGIRPALYFGVLLGRELRAVVEGRQALAQALRRYEEVHEEHRWDFDWLFRVQQSIRRLHGPLLNAATRAFTRPSLSLWAFGRYLEVCPPEAVLPAPPPAAAPAPSGDQVEVAA